MAIKNKPRQSHYLLGHEAFRVFAEKNPHQFFSIMASAHLEFIEEMVQRVENHIDIRGEINPEDFDVTLGTIRSYPLVMVKMPQPQAYVECFYFGVLGLFDVNQPAAESDAQIGYFTLELGEGEPDENGDKDCKIFCQWDGDTHYNLAETDRNAGIDEFRLLIEQRVGKE